MIPGGIFDSCLVGQETQLTTAGGAIPVGREIVSFWQTVPLCSGKELLAVEMESFTSLLIRVQDEPLWIIFRRDMVIRLKDELIMAGVPCIAIQYVTNIIIHGINIHHCKPGGNGSQLPTNRERGSQNNDFSLSTVVYEPLRDISVSAIAFHPVLLVVVTSRFGLAIVKVIRMINWFRGLDGHAMLLVHKGRNP